MTRLGFGLTTALVGALAISLAPAQGHADFKVCNGTAENLFVMWATPDSSCRSKLAYNLALLRPSGCTTLESGRSSKGRTFYYHAWTQSEANDREWRGDVDLWIPDLEGDDECVPQVGCRLSEGAAPVCSGGRNYPMREVKAASANVTKNLVL